MFRTLGGLQRRIIIPPSHTTCLLCSAERGWGETKKKGWQGNGDACSGKLRGENWAAQLTWFTLVVHVEVFGGAGAGVLPEQQVVDRQLAVSVALTLWQELLHGTHQGQSGLDASTVIRRKLSSSKSAFATKLKHIWGENKSAVEHPPTSNWPRERKKKKKKSAAYPIYKTHL